MKGGMKSLRREGSPDHGFFGGHSMFGEYTYESSVVVSTDSRRLPLVLNI
jgi:hypothetical protein